MKTVSLIAAAAAIAGVAGAAHAQPQTYDWTGPYIGLNLGWDNPSTHSSASTATVNQLTGLPTGAGGGTATVPPVTIATKPMDFDNSYRTGGMQVGYNRQMGMFVVGLEGDVDAQGNEHFGQGAGYALPGTALTTGSRVTINRHTYPQLTSTVRARAGIALGAVLFYGTGGLAIGEVRQQADYAYQPFPTAGAAAANPPNMFAVYRSNGDNRYLMTGWTLGGGVEWRLGRTISVDAEYRHMDFGSVGFTGGQNRGGGVTEATRLNYGDNQVLAKLNFHF